MQRRSTHRPSPRYLALLLGLTACEVEQPEHARGEDFRASAPLDSTDHDPKWQPALPATCTLHTPLVRDRVFGHTHCIDGELTECQHRERVTMRCSNANPASFSVVTRRWLSSDCQPLGVSCSNYAVTCGTAEHWCSEEYDVYGCNTGSHTASCDGEQGGSSATAFSDGGGAESSTGDSGGTCSLPPSPWEMLQDCRRSL